MKKERKVDNWIKMTKYIHYIEAMIERMENTETPLVYRQECLEDQRAMYIYLTGCGEKVTQTALNTYDQLLKQVNLKSISALTNMDENG